jgi:uncharacterized protein YuzE
VKLTYDPRRTIAYLRLLEKGVEVETIRVSDELNVDIAPDGMVYGISLNIAIRRSTCPTRRTSDCLAICCSLGR